MYIETESFIIIEKNNTQYKLNEIIINYYLTFRVFPKIAIYASVRHLGRYVYYIIYIFHEAL